MYCQLLGNHFLHHFGGIGFDLEPLLLGQTMVSQHRSVCYPRPCFKHKSVATSIKLPLSCVCLQYVDILLEIKSCRSYVTYISITTFLVTLCGGYNRASGHRCEHTLVNCVKRGRNPFLNPLAHSDIWMVSMFLFKTF